MTIRIRLFWAVLLVGSIAEYLHLSHSTALGPRAGGVVGILAIAVICLSGYLVTAALYSKRRSVTASEAARHKMRRKPIPLVGIYGYLALLFFVINTIPVFEDPDYDAHDSIWNFIDLRLVIASAVVLVGIGIVLTKRRK